MEPVARQALLRLALTDSHLTGVETVQPWWVRDNSVEVDVVAATSSATAVVGTIKWRTDGGITNSELTRLSAQRALVPRAEKALLAAICPSGQAPKQADVAYSAANLITAWASPSRDGLRAGPGGSGH